MGPLTVVAQYTANQYTINFSTNGGADVEAITLDYGYPVLPPAEPVKEGYKFVGWYNGEQKVENGDVFLSTSDTSLVARWEAIVSPAPEVTEPSGLDLLWLYFILSIMGGVGIAVGVYFAFGFVKEKRKAKTIEHPKKDN